MFKEFLKRMNEGIKDEQFASLNKSIETKIKAAEAKYAKKYVGMWIIFKDRSSSNKNAYLYGKVAKVYIHIQRESAWGLSKPSYELAFKIGKVFNEYGESAGTDAIAFVEDIKKVLPDKPQFKDVSKKPQPKKTKVKDDGSIDLSIITAAVL